MKHVVVVNVSHPEWEPLDILIKPGTTTADILAALKLTGYVLVPLSNPNKPFSKKELVYSKLSDGEDLCLINSTTYYLYFWTPTIKRIPSYDKPSKPLIDSEEARRKRLKEIEEADAYIQSFFINEEEPLQETAYGEEANDYSVSYDTKR
jgi:hypothetical protein